MAEWLAAVPTSAWMAGFLAAGFGGLCAALSTADREARPADPSPSPAARHRDLHDTTWARDALDDDPIWATDREAVTQ